MNPELAVIPLIYVPEESDPELWPQSRAELCRWTVEGKAQVRHKGAFLDVVTLSTLSAASDIDGCELVFFDRRLLELWQRTHT